MSFFVILYTAREKVRRAHHPEALDEKKEEKKGWIPQESRTEKQGAIGIPLPASPEHAGKEAVQWGSRSKFQARPRKPSSAIGRYRQLTITEMKLKPRAPLSKGDPEGQCGRGNPLVEHEMATNLELNSCGQTPQPNTEEGNRAVVALEKPVVGGEELVLGDGLGAGSECPRESLPSNAPSNGLKRTNLRRSH